MSAIDDHDLDDILRALYPMGHALLRREDGLVLIHHAARHLLGTPTLAREVLGSEGTRKMAAAVRARSERYAAIAERLQELADEPDSHPHGRVMAVTADSTTHPEPAHGHA
jgi:hypothetical protein